LGSPRVEVASLAEFPRAVRLGAREEVFRGSSRKEEGKDAIQRWKVLCPHDAEEVEKILCGVRRTCGAAPNSPRLALIRGCKSCRLHRNTLTNNRRRCFVLRVREREVVGDVVSELEEFGGFKGRKTAEQQSDQRDEDELGSHFKARSQGPLIQHPGSQLNRTSRRRRNPKQVVVDAAVC
jgi:hypothetical protein